MVKLGGNQSISALDFVPFLWCNRDISAYAFHPWKPRHCHGRCERADDDRAL